MIIGAILKTSLIDFPGKIAAVVYTRGCNFRCPFCHNPEMVNPEIYRPAMDSDEIFDYLKKRAGKIEGVTITGGEPLMHSDAADFIKEIKDLGYLVKLDTNGCYPELLENILKNNLVDYVAMDIKAPIEKYSKLSGVDVDTKNILKSISLIKSLAKDYEFRTTVVKDLLDKDDLISIIQMLGDAKRFIIQRFRCDTDILDMSYKNNVFTEKEFVELKEYVANYKSNIKVQFR